MIATLLLILKIIGGLFLLVISPAILVFALIIICVLFMLLFVILPIAVWRGFIKLFV
jgi:hypothetical protein